MQIIWLLSVCMLIIGTIAHILSWALNKKYKSNMKEFVEKKLDNK